MSEELCHEHSGCIRDIENLKNESKDQWKAIGDIRMRIDGIMTRLNALLGGIVVAIIIALINLALRIK